LILVSNQEEIYMNSKWVKSMALIFAIGAAQLNVVGSPEIMGKLKTRKNKPCLVNSNQATSGATILSGSKIVCPAAVGATVELGLLGRLDISASSDLTLVFDGSTVNVQLRSGYAILTTKKGIAGTVTTPDGKVFATEMSKNSSVVAASTGAMGPEVAATVGATGGGIGTAGIVGIAAGGAAAVGAGAAAATRGSNLSTDNPRQQ
jgi:hypothetical protein